MSQVSEVKRILVFSPFGSFRVHNQLDAIVASALRLRGCNVCIVGCDGIYKNCDVLAWSGEHADRDCANCAGSGKAFFNAFNLPYLQIRNYLAQNDYKLAQSWVDEIDPSDYSKAKYNDLPMGEWVTSSVFSYFRITTEALSQPKVREVHKQFLINGLLTYNAISRILNEYNPTNMIVFNGRFAPYRVAFEVAKKRGIKVLTHERGFADDTFILYENNISIASKPIFDITNAWKGISLTKQQLSQVKQYLTNREQGLDINFPSFYNYNTDYLKVRSKLRIPPNKKVFGVFTSSEFELAYSDDFKAITTQLELISNLIDVFRGRDEYLVIRHHPYISAVQLSPPELNFLSKAYQHALLSTENVRIIMPSEQISSYALFWNINAGISFFSTVGIEATARGIPMAAFASSPYSKAVYYTIEHSNKEYLNNLIDDLFKYCENFNSDDLRKVYHFINAYIYKLSTKFKSFGIKNHFEPDIRIRSFDDLSEGKDSTLDRVCDHIMKGTPLVDLPTEEDINRSRSEEDAFFQKEHAEIEETRRKVQLWSAVYSSSRLHPDIAIVHTSSPDTLEDKSLFSSWMRRSRYKNLVVYDCHCKDWRDSQAVLNSILLMLNSVKQNYILITNDLILYDESFISSAIDSLLDDHNLETKGIFSGAWIMSEQDNIEKEIFTKRVPAATYQTAVDILPLLNNPMNLLSLCLFRKESLIDILKTILAMPVEKKALKLFEIMNRPNIYKSELPMVLIRESINSEKPRN